MTRTWTALALLALLAATGCTTDQRLAAGRNAHRQECQREPGRTDRDRCAAQLR